MSEERLQEIKDSINFQYELIVSKGIDKSALLFTDEEQELVEEIERLNSIINELEKDLEEKIDEDRLNILSNSHWKYVLDKIKELKGSE